MVATELKFLTQEQVDHWMEHGFIRLPGALLPEWIDRWTEDMWIRLGFEQNDKSTWKEERVHMPWHDKQHASVVAPNAWAAICDLLGGEERIDPYCAEWRNNIILNLGNDKPTLASNKNPRSLENWHVDGDWFRHYLDSPEQALLVITLFNDIKPDGGATWICPDGIGKIAKVFLDHPEGVLSPQYGGFVWSSVIPQCNQFLEMTGQKGDVIILHPLMLHSASNNLLREPRMITNPPVMLKEPFCFNRENPDEFSLVELKTLRSLRLERVDYRVDGPRDRNIHSKRHDIMRERLEKELERLRIHSEKTGKPLESSRLKDVENVPW